MALPIFQTSDRILSMLQTQWSTSLNPVLSNPLVNGQLLKNVTLASGANVINHKLSRMMQGWMLTDINANETVYRSAAMNDTTLTLTSSGACTVSLWVF